MAAAGEARAAEVVTLLPILTRSIIILQMSTAEMVFEKTRALPDELQQEALRYLDTLLARKDKSIEAHNWARFSADKLLAQYAPADAIYDQD